MEETMEAYQVERDDLDDIQEALTALHLYFEMDGKYLGQRQTILLLPFWI